MVDLQNLLSFKFGELYFDRLMLRWSDIGFPWKSNKEREKYLSELVEEGSDLSSLIYKKLLREMGKKEIQIKISWSYLFRILGYLCISALFVSSFNDFKLAATIFGFICIISFIATEYFEERANELYAGLSMGPNIVDLMFEMEKNNGEIQIDENF